MCLTCSYLYISWLRFRRAHSCLASERQLPVRAICRSRIRTIEEATGHLQSYAVLIVPGACVENVLSEEGAIGDIVALQ